MSNPFRKLPKAALIYGMGDVLTKAASFLLLPILTRILTPEDYGIIGSVSAFAAILSLFLQLSLNHSILRFYADCADDQARRDLVGTLMVLSVGWSFAIVLLLNLAGAPLLDHIYKEVRFEPYLRVGTWMAFSSSLLTLPLTVLQMQQRPLLHRIFSMVGFLFSMGLVLLLVVGFRLGAFGSLLGQAIGTSIAAIPVLFFMRRQMNFVVRGPILKMCLMFSLPMVVYAMGGLVTDISNRIFIERYLNLGELGLFNIGNQFAMIMGFVIGGLGLAFTPLFYETVKQTEGPRLLARFGVQYVAVALGIGLLVAVFSRDALQLMTRSEYHLAYRVVPILTATQAITSYWHLFVNPLMLKKKTGFLAGLVILSAAFSIGLNFLLVPRYGIVGAALAPFIANLLLTAVVFVVSIRLYPVPYNYRQLALVALAVIGIYMAANRTVSNNLFLSIGIKALILGSYPILLLWFGIVAISDLRHTFAWLNQRITR